MHALPVSRDAVSCTTDWHCKIQRANFCPTLSCSIKHMPERQVVSEAATVTALSTSQASNSRVNEQVQAASSLLKETIHKLAVNFMAQSVHPNDPAHLQAVEYNLAVFRRQLRQLVTEDTNFW